MEPALRLMLWCGIRPTEVRRLQWSDIDPDEMLVYVEGQHSKTGGARAVPLRGGAAVLAEAATTATGLIAPVNWEHLWRELRLEAGFHCWQNDALRHTFASMHLKRFHNLPLLQEEMGHRNAALLQTRYLNLRNLKKNSATLFFQEKRWQ
jgi:integrase